jgi:hypothetical protein
MSLNMRPTLVTLRHRVQFVASAMAVSRNHPTLCAQGG